MTDGAATDRVRLEASWKAALADQFEAAYMKKLRAFKKLKRVATLEDPFSLVVVDSEANSLKISPLALVLLAALSGATTRLF